MQNKQFKLCCDLLSQLEREGILRHIVLIGSWCMLAYESFFDGVRYQPGIRTRDLDLLIPLPVNFDHDVDLEAILNDLGFVISLKGKDGYLCMKT